jgi:hypothetical protein
MLHPSRRTYNPPPPLGSSLTGTPGDRSAHLPSCYPFNDSPIMMSAYGRNCTPRILHKLRMNYASGQTSR